MRKKKNLMKSIAIVLVLALIAGSGYLAYTFKMQADEKTREAENIRAELDENSKSAWIATANIRAGEALVPDVNIELQPIYSGLESYMFWEPAEEGAVATIDIAAMTPVLTSMTTPNMPTNDVREIEVSTVNLMTTSADYDWVDIRISFPDGSDYVVIPKKQVKNLNLSTCVFTIEATEMDIQYMTSAILDAYLTAGARMYVTRYTEQTLQEPAVTTYPAKTATLNMLEASGNKNLTDALSRATVELNKAARLSLEERLGTITEEQAAAASEAWSQIQSNYINEVQRAITEAENTEE